MTFVGQLQLVLQVVETVVDRSCRKHEHLGLYTLADNLVHQLLIAVFLAWLILLHLVI